MVDVRACFSRKPERAGGFGYVTDRIWAEREELRRVWREGGVVFLCGSRGVAEGVAEVGARIWAEGRGEVEEGREWVGGVRGERFVTDVFG